MKIRMCWIPPGEFLMGSPEDELGHQEDETRHRVKITRGFWLAKYPVTQAQWEAVMGNRPSWFGRPSFWNGLFGGSPKELWDNHPVEWVSWEDVCGVENRTGGFLGKVNSGGSYDDRFHLPTEAQWEYACRAGTTGVDAGNLDQFAWYGRNSSYNTHPVSGKRANGWGLHDMYGNVWEWCADWYSAYQDGATTDSEGAASDAHPGSDRVVRGGSWHSHADGCRTACRNCHGQFGADNNIGFRLARSSVP